MCAMAHIWNIDVKIGASNEILQQQISNGIYKEIQMGGVQRDVDGQQYC